MNQKQWNRSPNCPQKIKILILIQNLILLKGSDVAFWRISLESYF